MSVAANAVRVVLTSPREVADADRVKLGGMQPTFRSEVRVILTAPKEVADANRVKVGGMQPTFRKS